VGDDDEHVTMPIGAPPPYLLVSQHNPTEMSATDATYGSADATINQKLSFKAPSIFKSYR